MTWNHSTSQRQFLYEQLGAHFREDEFRSEQARKSCSLQVSKTQSTTLTTQRLNLFPEYFSFNLIKIALGQAIIFW